ncbi:MAG: lipase secretion chaperone [Smithellaceae bacterium]
MTKKKKIFIAVGIAALLTFSVLFVLNYRSKKSEENYENYLEKHYIFDKNFQTGNTNRDSTDSKYFSQGIVTAEALNLYRFLEQKFELKSGDDLKDHYREVRQYLYSRFRETEAQKLFEIYQKYLTCQIKLANDKQYEVKTADPKHLLILLYKVQNYRRDKMGKETADVLFGSDVKEREYRLRMSIIIGDNTLYGKEKESRLQKLKTDIWDGEVVSTDEGGNSYNRYQFKLQLYHKDLSELGEKEREIKIEEFRKEFFTKEQIKGLHKVDAQIAREKQNMERYRAAEQNILNLGDISLKEKDKRIKLLQDKFFGSDADAFRRREAMRKALEK